MARRRGATVDTANTSALREAEPEDDTKLRVERSWDQESSRYGTKTTHTMPHTQEKRIECNISNNNDHNYLHKKFKKMASTTPVSSSETSKDNEAPVRESNIAKSDSNTAISNGSIAASHPEIEKIKVRQYQSTVSRDVERNVQTTFNDNNVRLSDVNEFETTTGKTSISNEFSNKTENLDNDFIKDGLNGAAGRYVCPYCKLSCAKPSVLQKHIRAHTNERPYPCVPCGFAFKTKSNLYKHRRSRTHALRLQGADVSTANEDDLSAGSESDTSLPPTSISDAGSDASVMRLENSRPNEFSSPELASDRGNSPTTYNLSSNDNVKLKTIYKPKFRAALYQEADEKEKYRKTFSPNADFLNEHISKIISANEAIVDVIETPLQKKYGKIKQIAESKQLHQINENNEVKFDPTPLNLTKSGNESESYFRKRSHSETFSQFDFHKHPLNPEGSIIKDLLLKTKANGLSPATSELLEGLTPQYVCPLCQIPYRSADNLEIHRMYYCKGSQASSQKDIKSSRTENVFVRSNSINVRLPETQTNSSQKNSAPTKSPPLRNNKPDNIIIVKPEPTFEVIAPLPSPGPLLGNTRLVDTRLPSEHSRKSEHLKSKPVPSPKRTPSDNYSPRISENMSPRSTETYSYSKIRCVEPNQLNLRPMEDLSQMHNIKPNTASLQMFGGEVKIVDHSGSTTTLRIEPSKNQLSPILIQQNLSPNKHANDNESSIVVRSGLHSGGTIVHNPPTPKIMVSTPHPQTPRIIISTVAHSLQSTNISNMQEIQHFQFPPLSAITAFNPLTLPPLSPSTPNGAISILHGGKLIPHVPGMPGPNTPSLYIGTPSGQTSDAYMSPIETPEMKHGNASSINIPTSKCVNILKYEMVRNSRSPNSRQSHVDTDKYTSNNAHSSERKNLPLIKIKNVDELPSVSTKSILPRHDGAVKRGADGLPRTPGPKDNSSCPTNKLRISEKSFLSNVNKTTEQEIRNFNFETLITKAEIYNNQIPSSSEVQKNTTEPATSKTSPPDRSETLYFQKNTNVKSGSDDRKPKFLRPSTLPLKPGTFTPKRHHGITPNANTMPLVSPETPRPAKAYGQFYANGNAYTYLGLKSSTKVFYCTINRPQPTYVPNQHFLSMYSNWQLLSELTPDPLGLTASSAMSLYDSRHRPQNATVAKIKQDLILTHSSQWNENSDSKQSSSLEEGNRMQQNDGTLGPRKELTGGFESNEEYTYIRGRGRGRYVCSECGIRCKKPSMLKKHIRTHTNVRPYTCTHCVFSFKTKGNLTKHMKSKAHFKKCCELGINPNEGAEEGGDIAQCSGETDDDTDSDGDEGNEGETESDDTEVGKSRLPEHEAARCLLSLGCSRPATSDTPGLITSARPTTYPYTPIGLEAATPERDPESLLLVRSTSVDSRTDSENEPMDLSKSEVRTSTITEIPTARESSVLASLASNTAKLPHQPSQWSNGEPMLHAYLTEKALQDSKIKQSQLTGNMSKLRKVELEKTLLEDKKVLIFSNTTTTTTTTTVNSAAIMTTSTSQVNNDTPKTATVNEVSKPIPNGEILKPKVHINESPATTSAPSETKKLRTEGNAENAKFVVSEYLKLARVNSSNENPQNQADFLSEGSNPIKNNVETVSDDPRSDEDCIKLPVIDHEPVARKVVIGAGGVAFKVTKGKEFDGMGSYSPGRLMEDGRRVCDFCNKTFTKPSQLRLHLNIHYMERPFRCSACAVSFRTRGHLQKHERSGSHHNKVSMTSTFGAATSQNPRPFRCSDCNIAFRIHGHLAKHLRSKMHVMRLECLFKLPFGTFTEIERAGVSLTDIDTTDCASSLASLQMLARKLHEMDPSKLEYREPAAVPSGAPPPAGPGPHSSDDEDNTCDSERDIQMRTIENSESHDTESRVIFSATDN